MSQSPQIGSMFPTRLCLPWSTIDIMDKSQSPQIGSMFPTADYEDKEFLEKLGIGSQSPQIGSMFPTYRFLTDKVNNDIVGRNPLKSGQCFLHK